MCTDFALPLRIHRVELSCGYHLALVNQIERGSIAGIERGITSGADNASYNTVLARTPRGKTGPGIHFLGNPLQVGSYQGGCHAAV